MIPDDPTFTKVDNVAIDLASTEIRATGADGVAVASLPDRFLIQNFQEATVGDQRLSEDAIVGWLRHPVDGRPLPVLLGQEAVLDEPEAQLLALAQSPNRSDVAAMLAVPGINLSTYHTAGLNLKTAFHEAALFSSRGNDTLQPYTPVEATIEAVKDKLIPCTHNPALTCNVYDGMFALVTMTLRRTFKRLSGCANVHFGDLVIVLTAATALNTNVEAFLRVLFQDVLTVSLARVELEVALAGKGLRPFFATFLRAKWDVTSTRPSGQRGRLIIDSEACARMEWTSAKGGAVAGGAGASATATGTTTGTGTADAIFKHVNLDIGGSTSWVTVAMDNAVGGSIKKGGGSGGGGVGTRSVLLEPPRLVAEGCENITAALVDGVYLPFARILCANLADLPSAGPPIHHTALMNELLHSPNWRAVAVKARESLVNDFVGAADNALSLDMGSLLVFAQGVYKQRAVLSTAVSVAEHDATSVAFVKSCFTSLRQLMGASALQLHTILHESDGHGTCRGVTAPTSRIQPWGAWVDFRMEGREVEYHTRLTQELFRASLDELRGALRDSAHFPTLPGAMAVKERVAGGRRALLAPSSADATHAAAPSSSSAAASSEVVKFQCFGRIFSRAPVLRNLFCDTAASVLGPKGYTLSLTSSGLEEYQEFGVVYGALIRASALRVANMLSYTAPHTLLTTATLGKAELRATSGLLTVSGDQHFASLMRHNPDAAAVLTAAAAAARSRGVAMTLAVPVVAKGRVFAAFERIPVPIVVSQVTPGTESSLILYKHSGEALQPDTVTVVRDAGGVAVRDEGGVVRTALEVHSRLVAVVAPPPGVKLPAHGCCVSLRNEDVATGVQTGVPADGRAGAYSMYLGYDPLTHGRTIHLGVTSRDSVFARPLSPAGCEKDLSENTPTQRYSDIDRFLDPRRNAAGGSGAGASSSAHAHGSNGTHASDGEESEPRGGSGGAIDELEETGELVEDGPIHSAAASAAASIAAVTATSSAALAAALAGLSSGGGKRSRGEAALPVGAPASAPAGKRRA